VGDVGGLPGHPLLVGDQPLDRCPREADQRHIAVIQVDERAVQPVSQVRAPWARTPPEARIQRAGNGEPSNVVRLRRAGRGLEPFEEERELPPRADA
jgi:hypothetical protein